MVAQASSSDTTGWFARDATTFARVSGVLLGETPAPPLPHTLLIAVDAFGFCRRGSHRCFAVNGGQAHEPDRRGT